MKRVYEKPVLEVELFQLDAEVASSSCVSEEFSFIADVCDGDVECYQGPINPTMGS